MIVLEENVLPRYRCGRPSHEYVSKGSSNLDTNPAHRFSSNVTPLPYREQGAKKIHHAKM